MWWWCGRWCCWGELPRQCGRLDELANLRWVLWARQLRGPASRGGLLSLLGQKKVIKEKTLGWGEEESPRETTRSYRSRAQSDDARRGAHMRAGSVTDCVARPLRW